MRTAVVLLGLFPFLGVLSEPLPGQSGFLLPAVTAEDTYFTVHNLRRAHGITLGAGAKVGILDHSFQAEVHPELYAGGEDFLNSPDAGPRESQSHRGYWMALALHEIAPEAEIFALNTHHPDEGTRVQAMIRALDWAVENELDAVTYCGSAFSPEAQKELDPAVKRAIDGDVVVVFVNYSHPMNILPGGIGQEVEKGWRTPDLKIFSYECALAFADQHLALLNPDDDRIPRYRPSLARPSAGPVTAGFVALVRSLAPAASPDEVKKILVETSRSVMFEGVPSPRVPDVFEAVRRVSRTQLPN